MNFPIPARAMALTFALGLALPVAAFAQVSVHDAWVRGTVAQQKASGLFAVITAAKDSTLVAASTPVAGVVEIHEMKMEGSTMKMRALTSGLTLPAGQAVELKPGGYHVMLMDLKQQLKAGDIVPVTLVVEGADGKRENVEIQAPVKALGAGGMHGGMKH
jgi:copper(I)-binding protein